MSDFRSGQPIRLFDEDNIPYSGNNPVPVTLEESEAEEIHDYAEQVDVAKRVGATVTSEEHIYTVAAGKTFLLEKVLYGASGRMRVELAIETAVASDVYTTKAVGFNSSSNPSEELNLNRALKVAAGVRVKVILSNLDNDDQSLYSTMIGILKDEA